MFISINYISQMSPKPLHKILKIFDVTFELTSQLLVSTNEMAIYTIKSCKHFFFSFKIEK